MKALYKTFCGTTKKCENKKLQIIHFGKKSRNTRNGKGYVLIKARGRDTGPHELIFHPFWESSIYELIGSHSLNIILCSVLLLFIWSVPTCF